jgi:HEAT repeat protein
MPSYKREAVQSALLSVAGCACLLLAGCPAGRPTGQAEQDKAAAEKGPDKGPSYQGKTVAAWIAQLGDTDAQARQEAYGAISRITRGPAPRGEQDGLAFNPALHDPNGALLPALAEALKSKDRVVRSVVTGFLGLYGEKAVPVFTAALKDPDAHVRRTGVDGLDGLLMGSHRRPGDPYLESTAVEAMIPVLAEVLFKDKDEEARGAADRVLWGIGKRETHAPAVVAALIGALKSDNVKVRNQAVFSLGRVGPRARKAVPSLAELLKEEDPELRYSVAQALGEIGEGAGEAVPALIAATKAPDSGGEYAAKALGKIPKAPLSTVPALLALLKDPEPDVRLRAVKVLCDLGEGDKECLAVLMELLRRRDPQIRQQVAVLLFRYGSAAKAAVPALIDVVRTEGGQTRYAAIKALGAIGPDAKSAVPALKALQDDPFYGGPAKEALKQIEP